MSDTLRDRIALDLCKRFPISVDMNLGLAIADAVIRELPELKLLEQILTGGYKVTVTTDWRRDDTGQPSQAQVLDARMKLNLPAGWKADDEAD